MPIGPALPPHLAHLASGSRSSGRSPSASPPRTDAQNGVEVDEEDEDDFGPALPPHLAAARQSQNAGPSSETTPTAGPSRPPLALDSPSPPRLPARGPAGPSLGQYDEDESDDDDVIGPVLPSAPVKEKTAAEEFMEREERMKQSQQDQSQPSKPQREEWMLVPPSSGILSSVDPLRKRPTTFSKNTHEVEIDSTVWTETPQEKAQRLADEVAGIKRKKNTRPGEGQGDGESARKRMRDEEIRASVDRHNKEMRGKSLLEQHAAKDKKKEDAPAIWDHSRDMGITGRLLSEKERSDKIRDARNLNDRFGHSKRGAYDM